MSTPVKYGELKDLKWVFEQLKIMSPTQLAKKVGCPLSSILWTRDRYFSEEMKNEIKYERKSKKRNDKILDMNGVK